MLQLLYHTLTTKLCRTFMITLWMVNRFETHILRIHCFNNRHQHIVRAQSARTHARRHSINCAINCTLLKAVLNVQQFLNVVNSWLLHALLDKAVN